MRPFKTNSTGRFSHISHKCHLNYVPFLLQKENKKHGDTEDKEQTEHHSLPNKKWQGRGKQLNRVLGVANLILVCSLNLVIFTLGNM